MRWFYKCLEHVADPLIQFGLWPTPRGGFLVADAPAIKVRIPLTIPPQSKLVETGMKIILNSRQIFPKSTRRYGILNFFGTNIITTESDEWKRHRKTVAPAFGEVCDCQCHDQVYRTMVCRKTTN